MLSNLFLRRLLIPVSGSFVVYAAKTDEKQDNKVDKDKKEKTDKGDKDKDKKDKGDQKDKKKQDECAPKKKVVPRDLPLYVEEPDCPKCKKEEHGEVMKPSILTDSIRVAREELWVLKDEIVILSRHFSSYFLVAKRQTESTLEYLREECNFAPRMGAIAVGGLAGYILALRKGRFKRVLYTGAGATAMAALCYPKEAKEYTDQSLKQMKKYVIITYHFLNGDTADTEKLEREAKLSDGIDVNEEDNMYDEEDYVYVQKTVPPDVSSKDPACRCPRHPRFQKEQKDKKKEKKDKKEAPPKCEEVC